MVKSISLAIVTIAACGELRDGEPAAVPRPAAAQTAAAVADTPVGLALDIEDGTAATFRIRKGQRFYIDQIDLRAHRDRAVDEGVAGLDQAGDFAALDWTGIALVDQSFVSVPNPDGTFTRRRMYRGARWMNDASLFTIEQLDARGQNSGDSLIVDAGRDDQRSQLDAFFVRRLRAIQWANDCASSSDCTTAKSFMEEALVELRHGSPGSASVRLGPATAQLRVTWSANPHHRYAIPVEQVERPAWDYGFAIDLAVTTPPGAGGVYQPGQALTVQLTLRDGAGKPLHPPGVLPTLQDYQTGNDPAGIDYWNVPEKVMTYYRRKHMEKQMVIAIVGPMQATGTNRDTLDFIAAILGSHDGAVAVATPDAQGFYAEAAAVPAWRTLIGVDPPGTPVGDTVQLTLPANAAAGTYKIVMKARRSYLSQEIAAAKVIEIQVGTARHTARTLDTGPCTSCHQGSSDLARVSHALPADQRDVCTTCHVPLPFEPEGPLYVRTHFIHARTHRLGAPLIRCANCHLDAKGIQRTSKSACLSCHTRYPPDHVARYGPVVDMYIGGTLADSFGVCSTTCHTSHPSSGLGAP